MFLRKDSIKLLVGRVKRNKKVMLILHCKSVLYIHSVSYYILEQVPPLGNPDLLNNIGHMGYRWIRLDPQGPKTPAASGISGPDQRGRRRQVPGGPEPGHPQGLIFWKSC